MGVDPDGRIAFLVVIAVILIAAAIAGGTNAAVQASTVGWGNVNWGLKGVAGAAIVGGVAGACTMGVGAVVGGVAGGALAGAVGGAAAYSTSVLVTGSDFRVEDLARSTAVGAVTGLVSAGTTEVLGDTAGAAYIGAVAGGVAGYGTNALLGGDASWQSLALSLGIGLGVSLSIAGVSALVASAGDGSGPDEAGGGDADNSPAGSGHGPDPETHGGYNPEPTHPSATKMPGYATSRFASHGAGAGRPMPRPTSASTPTVPPASTGPASSPGPYHGEVCREPSPWEHPGGAAKPRVISGYDGPAAGSTTEEEIKAAEKAFEEKKKFWEGVFEHEAGHPIEEEYPTEMPPLP
jgi:hypothetical protein